jgi:F-type H+-transporting ATPase subunit b
MAEATTSTSGKAELHPTWGLDVEGWVTVSFLVFVGILLYLKVPAMIGKALDGRTAKVRSELDEAKRLRAEAEALLASYGAKAEQAGRDAEAILATARAEAAQMVEDAKGQVEALIARRTAMAESKIAAAERAAESELRGRAVDLATAAARTLIATETDAKAKAKLTTDAITELERRLH